MAGAIQPAPETADDGGSAGAMPNRMALVLPRMAPVPSTPELQQFIDAVIVPALLERLLREHEPTA